MSRSPCRYCGESMEGKPTATRYCGDECKEAAKHDADNDMPVQVRGKAKKPKPIDPMYLVRGKISSTNRGCSMTQEA